MKQIWIKENILASKILKKIQKKIDEFQVSADLGQIPEKINFNKYFSNFIADQ